MKDFSVCHSISKQEHKILGRSMASSADLNLQKGYYIPESVTPRICTGDTRLEATDCPGGWAGHQSADGEQLYCTSLISHGCYSSLPLTLSQYYY